MITSAFGPNTSLYDTLQCASTATPTELKKAYRRVALLYHPDKVQARLLRNGDEKLQQKKLEDAKQKFQAVSAAYEVLQSAEKRAFYDKTGRIENEEGVGNSSGTNHAATSKKGQQWEDFFQSVFREMGNHSYGSAKEYRGSNQEKEDVIHYYKLCKGNLAQAVDCVVHGEEKDILRWERDIIGPAISSGKLEDLNGKKKKSKKRRLQKLSSSKQKKTPEEPKLNSTAATTGLSVLDDTDDEDDSRSPPQAQRQHRKDAMSKKDKLALRVAKKQKVKAQREMEVANIIGSKEWTDGGSVRRERAGIFHNALLQNLEQKYSAMPKRKRLKKKR